jgi:hypothetical protein
MNSIHEQKLLAGESKLIIEKGTFAQPTFSVQCRPLLFIVFSLRWLALMVMNDMLTVRPCL